MGEHEDSILSLMGHDLRNRFAAIQTGLSMLERYGGAYGQSERGGALLQRVSRQVAETVVWVEDLVRVARPGQGARTLPETSDLVDVLEGAVERTRAGRRGRGQTLIVVLPAPPVHIGAERPVLDGLVGLLLIGASLQTPTGGALRVAAGEAGGTARVVVEVCSAKAAPAALADLTPPMGLELSVVSACAERLGGCLQQDGGRDTVRSRLRLELPSA